MTNQLGAPQDTDLVPSDIAAGLALLHQQQDSLRDRQGPVEVISHSLEAPQVSPAVKGWGPGAGPPHPPQLWEVAEACSHFYIWGCRAHKARPPVIQSQFLLLSREDQDPLAFISGSCSPHPGSWVREYGRVEVQAGIWDVGLFKGCPWSGE